MGATAIPTNVPPEQLAWLSLRALPESDPSMEPDSEWYDTRTGVAVREPADEDEE